MEEMHEYKAERDLYEENLNKNFGKELEEQTAKMMEAHKVSLKIHDEIDYKQKEHMIHRIINSSAAIILSIFTFTIILAVWTLRNKGKRSIGDMKMTTNSILNLKSLVENLIVKQKKIPVKNITVENDGKEISTELVIPNPEAKENMKDWTETLRRIYDVANINEKNILSVKFGHNRIIAKL